MQQLKADFFCLQVTFLKINDTCQVEDLDRVWGRSDKVMETMDTIDKDMETMETTAPVLLDMDNDVHPVSACLATIA